MEAEVDTSSGRIASVAEHIGTPETAATFFKLAIATGDMDFVFRALHILAHSRGMADALAWAGLPCDYLRRALEAEGRLLMHALSEVSKCLTARLDEPVVSES
jgi:DNA-binding phage protein